MSTNEDYARALARKWFHEAQNSKTNWGGAIEGAAREALARAAKQVADSSVAMSLKKRSELYNQIMALGAVPPIPEGK